MEKISWTDRVSNEEVSHRVKEESNIVYTVKRRTDNWISHSFRKNRHLKYVIEEEIEGKIEVMGRRGRRCKLLLDDLKEMKEHWKMEREVLDRTMWRTGFGSGYESVVTELINLWPWKWTFK